MIPLPKVSKKWNFRWELLERKGDYAIMKQSPWKSEAKIKEELEKGIEELAVNYNVIKVLQAPEARLGKNVIPAKEKIPADSQWGTYAWNFGRDLEKAREKLASLTK